MADQILNPWSKQERLVRQWSQPIFYVSAIYREDSKERGNMWYVSFFVAETKGTARLLGLSLKPFIAVLVDAVCFEWSNDGKTSAA